MENWKGCTEKNTDIYGVRLRKFPEGSTAMLNFQSLTVSLCTTRFNIKEFYMVLALGSMFCTDLRTDSDLCFIHH